MKRIHHDELDASHMVSVEVLTLYLVILDLQMSEMEGGLAEVSDYPDINLNFDFI